MLSILNLLKAILGFVIVIAQGLAALGLKLPTDQIEELSSKLDSVDLSADGIMGMFS